VMRNDRLHAWMTLITMTFKNIHPCLRDDGRFRCVQELLDHTVVAQDYVVVDVEMYFGDVLD